MTSIQFSGLHLFDVTDLKRKGIDTFKFGERYEVKGDKLVSILPPSSPEPPSNVTVGNLTYRDHHFKLYYSDPKDHAKKEHALRAYKNAFERHFSVSVPHIDDATTADSIYPCIYRDTSHQLQLPGLKLNADRLIDQQA